MEVSKGDFAALVGLSAGRISQMIASGIIGRDALSGEGRSARIIVERAKDQIKTRRNVGQALGNGLLTKLDDDEVPPGTDDVARQIQNERLLDARRKNRLAAIDEARALGNLVEGEALQREVGKAGQALVNAFMGMAPDIANAIAAKFGVSQRDVLHEVRHVMNERRKTIALKQRNKAAEMPETVEVVVE